MRALTMLVLLALVASPLSGCLGLFGDDDDVGPAGNQGLDRLDENTRDRLANRVSEPRNYTFAGQENLPPTVAYFNGSVGSDSNAAVEDRNDRGGNSLNTLREVFDVTKYIPVGQPTEMQIVVYSEPQPGSSADLDIYVNVPGTHTDFAGDNGDEFNWKWQVQRMTVNTVGVAGRPHEVGVQIANGKVVSEMAFTVRVDFSYEADVVTPYHAYAFEVPRNATGIILESAKAGGSDHVKSRFVVIGPDDSLVQYQEYNDLAIPTESVYIPASKGPGEYVFYAFEMEGGFLRLFADAPVPNREVRTLTLKETTEMVASGPQPGPCHRDWGRGTTLEGGSLQTDGAAGETTVAVTTFPLRITPVVEGTGPTACTQVTVSTAKGVVSQYSRLGRVDTDQGHVGYTSEYWNMMFNPQNLQAGELTVTFTNDSPSLSAGYVLLTYQR